MQQWNDVEGWLGDIADDDLRHDGGVRSTLVAFAADRPLLLVRCRAFAAGQGRPALREVLDIAVPLGADRIAVSYGGRAWTADDGTGPPGPGDAATAREILLIVIAERGDGGVDLRCTLRAIEHGRCGQVISRSSDANPAIGWLARVLTDALRAPVVPPPPEVIAQRAMHSITLGHELHVPEEQHATAR